MSNNPFSFKGRINRKEYLIAVIIYLAILFFSNFVLVLTNKTDASSIIGIVQIILFWYLLAQGTKRCHDINKEGWYQLIPFYFFIMLFTKGENFTNDFGDPPLKYKKLTKYSYNCEKCNTINSIEENEISNGKFICVECKTENTIDNKLLYQD